tara:strand:- start:227 stop:871 length:645 start_codon:yes stop_codon:yes gene_type:complete
VNYFDINHFYNYGFAFVKGFDKEIAQLSSIMKQTTWVSNPVDDRAYKIPDWLRDKLFDDPECEVNPPVEVESLLLQMMESSYFFNMTGNKTISLYDTYIYNGTRGQGWHWEGYEVPYTCPWFMMIYFNDDWKEDHAGQIEFGPITWDLDVNIYNYETACNYSFNSDVTPTHSIAPLAGTCLLATNQNPTILHRVLPSNPKYDRLALLAVFQVEV